jgi:ABC-type glycerol-3-phosphate transport system substrate-binding protein
VAPLPKGPRRRAGLGHNIGTGVPAGVRHSEESWALVKHLTSPEGLAPFAKLGRSVPLNRRVWDAALTADGRPSRYKQAILDAYDGALSHPILG